MTSMDEAARIVATTRDPRMRVGPYYAVLQSCRIRSVALHKATGRSLEDTDREVVFGEAIKRGLHPSSIAILLEDLSHGL